MSSLVTPFVHGLLLAGGLIVALGPQNVFVFQQGTLQPRLRDAAPTVVTAGVADTVLVVLAVSGVSLVVLRYGWLQTVLFGVGVVFLVYVGWAILTSPRLALDPENTTSLGPRRQISFTAGVSLLNPHAILDTIGVIGTSALAYDDRGKAAFTAACLFVSWTWFVGLAVAGSKVSVEDGGRRWTRYVNPIAAAVVWLVALYMGWQFATAVGVV
ncbi:LysE/ArgO family amino acid transporter [Salinigranum marinum]|uniref:LysE/ArgO family amino acid transporter n=1 Tax=Salinigranum marinum TaxID=1515595 RepID=UPI002989CDDF|nr:LysE family transporter [Salinigranum marinum]